VWHGALRSLSRDGMDMNCPIVAANKFSDQ
jgi:hypothetical protein